MTSVNTYENTGSNSPIVSKKPYKATIVRDVTLGQNPSATTRCIGAYGKSASAADSCTSSISASFGSANTANVSCATGAAVAIAGNNSAAPCATGATASNNSAAPCTTGANASNNSAAPCATGTNASNNSTAPCATATFSSNLGFAAEHCGQDGAYSPSLGAVTRAIPNLVAAETYTNIIVRSLKESSLFYTSVFGWTLEKISSNSAILKAGSQCFCLIAEGSSSDLCGYSAVSPQSNGHSPAMTTTVTSADVIKVWNSAINMGATPVKSPCTKRNGCTFATFLDKENYVWIITDSQYFLS